MSAACGFALDWAELVDYWAGELEPVREAEVDEHLLGCDEHSQLSARVAQVSEAVRAMLPIVLSPAHLSKLRARGLTILENPMTPGERKDVVFPAHVDVLIHRLGGLDLRDAARVRFSLSVESSGAPLAQDDDVPFDRETGSVLLACQKHYAVMPPDTVAELRIADSSGHETQHRYVILHAFER